MHKLERRRVSYWNSRDHDGSIMGGLLLHHDRDESHRCHDEDIAKRR